MTSASSENHVTATTWNGGICATCGANYLGSHTCTFRDLMARAERLREMAFERVGPGGPEEMTPEEFDEAFAKGQPVDLSTRSVRCGRCPLNATAVEDPDFRLPWYDEEEPS